MNLWKETQWTENLIIQNSCWWTLEKLEMNPNEQEPMMESDDDEQMDNAPQNGIDEDLNSSQGKV